MAGTFSGIGTAVCFQLPVLSPASCACSTACVAAFTDKLPKSEAASQRRL
jgi:hypothetical protein